MKKHLLLALAILIFRPYSAYTEEMATISNLGDFCPSLERRLIVTLEDYIKASDGILVGEVIEVKSRYKKAMISNNCWATVEVKHWYKKQDFDGLSGNRITIPVYFPFSTGSPINNIKKCPVKKRESYVFWGQVDSTAPVGQNFLHIFPCYPTKPTVFAADEIQALSLYYHKGK